MSVNRPCTECGSETFVYEWACSNKACGGRERTFLYGGGTVDDVPVPRATLETVREALRFARDQDYRHSGGGTILISSDGLEPVAAALDLLDRLLGDK